MNGKHFIERIGRGICFGLTGAIMASLGFVGLGLASTTAADAGTAVGVAWAGPAGATTTATFTTITGLTNPVLAGSTFTVSGTECDRVANVHPTGTLTFTDATTHQVLGSATLTPSATFVNCSNASVKDTEVLFPGSYEVQDLYTPGGSTPVQTSSLATYEQVVSDPITTATFTQVTTSANPTVTGSSFEIEGMECDRVADVHPTGTLAFENVTTGTLIGTVSLTPSTTSVNCSGADHLDTIASSGTNEIEALYIPGGSEQVTNSPVASCEQTVVRALQRR